jgi:hypothetical protein
MAMRSVALVASVGLIVSHSAFAAMDLTAYLRAKGAGNYAITTSGGEEYEGMGKGAFDGDLTTNPGRALMYHGYSNNKMEPAIELNVNLVDTPDKGLSVTSFRLYRLNTGDSLYKERTTHTFDLQASIDGSSWRTLYSTPEKQIWTDETPYRDYEIPVGMRGCYSRYRIKMYPDYSASQEVEDHFVVGFQELVLYGEIETFKVWNGADGEKWDASSLNWTNSNESAKVSAWADGACANFTADAGNVDVDGEKQVNGIAFAADSGCTIAGSRLKLYPSANILAGSGAVIGNDLCNTGFPVAVAHTGLLPRNPDNANQGGRVCLWKNRRLYDMEFDGAVIIYSGKMLDAKPYHMLRGKDGTTVQFQAKHVSGNKWVVFCFKILFDQEGSDVYGKILWVKFKWDAVEPGHDFEDASISARGPIYDAVNASGYGLKDITATGGEGPSPLSIGASFVSDSCYPRVECLPRSGEDSKTGAPVVYWKNRNVRDLAGIGYGQMLAHGDTMNETSVHYFTNDGAEASVQFQSMNASGARLCVKVQFYQEGRDIMARAVYAKYNWNNAEPHDFDGVASKANVRTTWLNEGGKTQAEGYSVRDIKAVFKGELTLTGRLEIAGDITVDGNTVLTLGADSLSLDNSYVGEGVVRFAAASGDRQSVEVTGVRTMNNVAVGGNLELTFQKDASLSVASLSFEEGATLSIVSSHGAKAFRIGVGKCLDLETVSKIKVNGAAAMQDCDGWIVRRPGLVLTIQ